MKPSIIDSVERWSAADSRSERLLRHEKKKMSDPRLPSEVKQDLVVYFEIVPTVPVIFRISAA